MRDARLRGYHAAFPGSGGASAIGASTSDASSPTTAPSRWPAWLSSVGTDANHPSCTSGGSPLMSPASRAAARTSGESSTDTPTSGGRRQWDRVLEHGVVRAAGGLELGDRRLPERAARVEEEAPVGLGVAGGCRFARPQPAPAVLRRGRG